MLSLEMSFRWNFVHSGGSYLISKISLETPQLSKSPIEYAGTASAMKAAMVYAEDHGLRRGSINLMIQVNKAVIVNFEC